MDQCVTTVIQYNGKTAGRDKLNRLIQYGTKLIVDILKKKGTNKETIQKLNSLISVLGMARVTYRIGMFVDLIQAATNSIKLEDTVLRLLLPLARLSTAGFLFYDTLAWTIKAKIVDGDVKDWSLKSTTFWFWAAILNIVRDLYECYRAGRSETINNGQEKTIMIDQNRKSKIGLDFLKNICDMFIAGEACGKIPNSQSVVGFCGVISSMVYIMEITWTSLKL